MDEFIGTIIAVAFDFAPPGWLLCNGQLISVQENQALFSLLGTNYGGDGSRNFGIPDLRGRHIVCQGFDSFHIQHSIAQKMGEPSVTLTGSNMPSTMSGKLNLSSAKCKVKIPFSDQYGTQSNPALGTVRAVAENGLEPLLQYASTETGHSEFDAELVGGGNAVPFLINGGGLPVPIRSPYLVLNYIICNEGIYPSRP